MKQENFGAGGGNLDLWLGKAAPRYTSYPPAPFFHAGVTEKDFIASLAKLPADEALSLYIHVPFCRALCLYCGCNTTVTNRADRVENYLTALKQEMTMIAAAAGKKPISRLHFGGGTPNILSDQAFKDLFDFLHQQFNFADVDEIAMELDPRTVTQQQAKTLAACGITRVSLGIQDFDPGVQAIINRYQPYSQVAEVCDWLRAAGIGRINFDLIYGLPKQTPQTVADTAQLVCTLGPDRIALFSYAHVPQFKKHQLALEAYGLPDGQTCLILEQTVREVLTHNGFSALGIDHFAKAEDALMQAQREGRLKRNFQGYTNDNAGCLIGLGASSISQTRDGYFQNEPDEADYQSALGAGYLSVRRGFLLTPEDILRRAIIEQLMCAFACDVAAFCQQHQFDIDIFADAFEQLKIYQQAGIVALQGNTIRLESPYRMAIRVICKVFDHYSSRSQKLSSRVA